MQCLLSSVHAALCAVRTPILCRLSFQYKTNGAKVDFEMKQCFALAYTPIKHPVQHNTNIHSCGLYKRIATQSYGNLTLQFQQNGNVFIFLERETYFILKEIFCILFLVLT